MLMLSGCGEDGGSEIVAADIPAAPTTQFFQRISSFPVYLNSQFDTKTVAERVAVSEDGNTLIYSDRSLEKIGFVDISNAAAPVKSATVDVGGKPTSVVVRGSQVLVAVNTSLDFVNVSGKLLVINIATRNIVRTIDLAGQPDAMALSPDETYAAIAIENKRDDGLKNGEFAQAPAGLLQVIDLAGDVSEWSASIVSLTGMAELLTNDPEPVFVDINQQNIALVSLQKNNHFVQVDLTDGIVVGHFSAGNIDLNQVDATQDGLISMLDSRDSVLREPDAVSWMGSERFVSANLNGGSGGFTVFDRSGSVLFDSGQKFEHIIAQHGHFAERRAGAKDYKPENVEYAIYGDDEYLFVGSERSSVVQVYRVTANSEVQFVQLLPAGVSPDGLLAIPGRNLLVSAAKRDDRKNKIRSTLTLYQLQEGDPVYPTVLSASDESDLPLGWGALSGLSMDSVNSDIAYTISDAFYASSRIFEIDISASPAQIRRSIIIRDSLGLLTAKEPALVNGDADNTVNLDPEGITNAAAGGFWIASEGKGDRNGTAPVFEYENLLLRVSPAGVIEEVVSLPVDAAERQLDDGFEGVASVIDGDVEMLYVAFQSEWSRDRNNFVRLGRYNTDSAEWHFFNYELDASESTQGGKVVLSDITYLGNHELMVIERDNQSGLAAAIKRLYKFSIEGLVPLVDDGSKNISFPPVTKVLVDDLLDDLKATGGQVLEKIEGLAVTPDGTVLIVNDNDGVQDSNGETQLLRLKGLL